MVVEACVGRAIDPIVKSTGFEAFVQPLDRTCIDIAWT